MRILLDCLWSTKRIQHSKTMMERQRETLQTKMSMALCLIHKISCTYPRPLQMHNILSFFPLFRVNYSGKLPSTNLHIRSLFSKYKSGFKVRESVICWMKYMPLAKCRVVEAAGKHLPSMSGFNEHIISHRPPCIFPKWLSMSKNIGCASVGDLCECSRNSDKLVAFGKPSAAINNPLFFWIQSIYGYKGVPRRRKNNFLITTKVLVYHFPKPTL